MEQIIIHQRALSLNGLNNLKEFNREHKPVIVTVVGNDGYSKRFKITEEEVKYIDIHISSVPTGSIIIL